MGSKTEYFEEDFHESGKVEYEDNSGKCEATDTSITFGKVEQQLAGWCGLCGHKFSGLDEIFCPICGMKRETLK